MTKNQFKKGLQSEMNAGSISFRNPIVKVFENVSLHTVIEFTYPIDDGAKEWLQNRFANGVTFLNDNKVSVNFPTENNKNNPTAKAPEEKPGLTHITFEIFSKNNPQRFKHQIFKEGRLTRDQAVNEQHEYIRGRNTSGKLKWTDVSISYYTKD